MSFEATAELYRDVPKADLLTIDFANLFDKDPKELAKLIYACESIPTNGLLGGML